MPQGWMATRIPALIFDGIVEIGCLFFLYLIAIYFVLCEPKSNWERAIKIFGKKKLYDFECLAIADLKQGS